MSRNIVALLRLALLLAWPAASIAQAASPAPVELALTGVIKHPGQFSLEQLQAMPGTTVKIVRVGASATQTATYTGVLLWTLVDAAVPIDAPGLNTHLQHVLVARGRDGYGVALAIAELAPDFEGKQVLVAYAEDGKPLAALRLVVPGDTRAGRSVRDLVAVEIK